MEIGGNIQTIFIILCAMLAIAILVYAFEQLVSLYKMRFNKVAKVMPCPSNNPGSNDGFEEYSNCCSKRTIWVSKSPLDDKACQTDNARSGNTSEFHAEEGVIELVYKLCNNEDPDAITVINEMF